MGLDMYLNAKKHVSGFSFEPEAKRKTFNALVRAAGLTKKEIKDGCSAEVTFDVGYWRKANQIHNWFVRNCQSGEDDCGEYSVSRESLAKLRHLCQETLETGTTSLLPTQSGFFFGSTEYDNDYKSDLKSTIKQLGNILDNPKFEGWGFYYRSSW